MKSYHPLISAVWKMYETKNFEGIKTRRASGVEDSIAVALATIKRCPESAKI